MSRSIRGETAPHRRLIHILRPLGFLSAILVSLVWPGWFVTETARRDAERLILRMGVYDTARLQLNAVRFDKEHFVLLSFSGTASGSFDGFGTKTRVMSVCGVTWSVLKWEALAFNCD